MGDQGRESKRADAPKREVRFAPDTVAKVENRSAPKISRKLIFGRLCRGVVFQRH
jgi:hypothetical protein